jgi:hypothetical protein
LILVCHTSERSRFSENRLAHIATRISAQTVFKTASLEDTQLYLQELCDVGFDNELVVKAFNESRGRYRLLSNACRTMEERAKQLERDAVTIADFKNMRLCEDVMSAFNKGVNK